MLVLKKIFAVKYMVDTSNKYITYFIILLYTPKLSQQTHKQKQDLFIDFLIPS